MSNLTNKKIESFIEKGVYFDGDGLRLRVDKNRNKSLALIHLDVVQRIDQHR